MTKRVLFVCTGNTCRSPMAEVFYNAMTKSSAASSAGTQASEGAPLSNGASAVFAKRGLGPVPHRARRVEASMLEQADSVYVMESMHADYLKRLFPGVAAKMSVLNVKDPIGGDAPEYEACADAIERALNAVILKEKSHAPNPR